MAKEHSYRVSTRWTGDRGQGTADYRAYSRNHEISADGKSSAIAGSSDPAFRGDAARYNPEELLVASLSTCHMLWVLHLSAERGIVVTSYEDRAEGVMRENGDGSGEFVRVILRPRMTIAGAHRLDEVHELHNKAHEMCFIARSVHFPVEHEPEVTCGAG